MMFLFLLSYNLFFIRTFPVTLHIFVDDCVETIRNVNNTEIENMNQQ